MTAELALALPAVVLVLAACLTGFQMAGQQFRLQDAAAAAARSVARGESPEAAAARAARQAPGATLARSNDADLSCVTLSAPAPFGLTIAAKSCALANGR